MGWHDASSRCHHIIGLVAASGKGVQAKEMARSLLSTTLFDLTWVRIPQTNHGTTVVCAHGSRVREVLLPSSSFSCPLWNPVATAQMVSLPAVCTAWPGCLARVVHANRSAGHMQMLA
jgi:hypothetical protein